MKTVGSRIRALRNKANMTQEDLAKALTAKGAKVNRVSVTRWESDKFQPSAYPIKCMAEIFGVSMDFIMTGISVSGASMDERAILEKIKARPALVACCECCSKLSDEYLEMAIRMLCSMVDKNKKTS
jgi:transcriptional regulator with XRE-family HTH domain